MSKGLGLGGNGNYLPFPVLKEVLREKQVHLGARAVGAKEQEVVELGLPALKTYWWPELA